VRLAHWRQDLQQCVNALIREPISQGASDVRPADVAQSLQHLPLRQAYVRLGTEGHLMQTLPLTSGVDTDEEQRRRLQLREQTRRTLCRHVSTVSGVRGEPPVTTPPELVQENETVTHGAPLPLVRRSRPLS
jgi:hypothetical protein